MNRFDSTGELAALDEAIQAHRSGLAAIPDDHPNLSAALSNLGVSLRKRFRHTSELPVLDKAVHCLGYAVQTCPSDHPNRAGHLSNLGSILLDWFDRTGDPDALMKAQASFLLAAHKKTGPLDVRLEAARRAVDADLMAGHVDPASKMAELAVSLLGMIAPRRLRRSDRQYRITRLAGLASTVATAAVAAGQVGRAVELLEQTRGLLIADTLDTRGDLSALRKHAPELGREFETLRQALDALDHTDTTTGGGYQQQSETRDQLLHDWDQLLDRIRDVPALSDFLRPVPLDKSSRLVRALRRGH